VGIPNAVVSRSCRNENACTFCTHRVGFLNGAYPRPIYIISQGGSGLSYKVLLSQCGPCRSFDLFVESPVCHDVDNAEAQLRLQYYTVTTADAGTKITTIPSAGLSIIKAGTSRAWAVQGQGSDSKQPNAVINA